VNAPTLPNFVSIATRARCGLPQLGSAPVAARRAGFTVVELMVALAVAGILGTLGAASFGGVIGRTRVTGDSNDLLNAIELTRSEAAKRGRRVTMLPVRGDWAAGWTIFVDLDGNRQVDAGEPVIAMHPPLARTTRVIANTTPGYIAFAANGMPQQYTGGFLAATLALCDAGTARSIVLAKTGRPRVVAGVC
jgi:type IV fimbrial biogenesis protein FimT